MAKHTTSCLHKRVAITQARFLLTALLIFTSLSCSKYMEYRIRDARVVDSEGSLIQFEIKDKENLTVYTEDFELEFTRLYVTYSVKSSGGRFWLSIGATNTSPHTQEIFLRSLKFTPFKWIARDNTGPPEPLILDSTDILKSTNRRLFTSDTNDNSTLGYDRVDTILVEPGESSRGSVSIEWSQFMIRGQISAVFYCKQSDSEIYVDFILYKKGRSGKEPLIMHAHEQISV